MNSLSESSDQRRKKTALILNSRQTKQPIGADPWVRNTVAAVEHAIQSEFTILTSVGMNTYELVLYLASRSGARMIVLLPPASVSDNVTAAEIIRDFHLDPRRCSFVPITDAGKRPKDWWIERDSIAIRAADIILPVSVNPDGTLARLIRLHKKAEAAVDESFSSPYDLHRRGTYLPIDPSTISPIDGKTWNSLTHWTRSLSGPWPDETKYDFYRSVAESDEVYSHSALATLENILRSGVLCGSAQKIRGEFKVVPFTDLSPCEAVKLMRWRARFVRWNFEPYGIAVDRDCARSIGIRPVIYARPADHANLPDEDKPYFQNMGERGGDWKPEREWRYHGDVRLSAIPASKMKIIVRRPSEIDQIQHLTSSEVISLTTEP